MLGLSIGLEHPDDGWWCTTWTTPPVTAHTRSQMREGRIVAPGGPSESSPLTCGGRLRTALHRHPDPV